MKMVDERKNSLRKSGRDLKIGDTFFVQGSSTKIKIVGKPEYRSPECEVLEIGKTSKYQIGQTIRILCQILYSRKRKK